MATMASDTEGIRAVSCGEHAPSGDTSEAAARAAKPASVLTLKVTLRGSSPPIWRRLEVPADITLDRLHAVLLTAFDWDGGHLHVFEAGGESYGAYDPELGHRGERGVGLARLAPVGASLRYTYDFGDDWEHVIAVEKRMPAQEDAAYPRCTGGRRAAPPDDCGGVRGYAVMLEAIADPAHDEHEHYVEWAGHVLGLSPDEVMAFDPAAFDRDWVNVCLTTLAARHASAMDDEQLESGMPW